MEEENKMLEDIESMIEEYMKMDELKKEISNRVKELVKSNEEKLNKQIEEKKERIEKLESTGKKLIENRRKMRGIKENIKLVNGPDSKTYKAINEEMSEKFEEIKSIIKELNETRSEVKDLQGSLKITSSKYNEELQKLKKEQIKEANENKKQIKRDISNRVKEFVKSTKEDLNRQIEEKTKRIEELEKNRKKLIVDKRKLNDIRKDIKLLSGYDSKSYKAISEDMEEKIENVKSILRELNKNRDELRELESSLASITERYDGINFNTDNGINILKGMISEKEKDRIIPITIKDENPELDPKVEEELRNKAQAEVEKSQEGHDEDVIIPITIKEEEKISEEESKAKAEEEAKKKAEEEAKKKAEEEAKKKAEEEAKAKAEEEAKKKAEEEAKAKAERQAKIRAERIARLRDKAAIAAMIRAKSAEQNSPESKPEFERKDDTLDYANDKLKILYYAKYREYSGDIYDYYTVTIDGEEIDNLYASKKDTNKKEIEEDFEKNYANSIYNFDNVDVCIYKLLKEYDNRYGTKRLEQYLEAGQIGKNSEERKGIMNKNNLSIIYNLKGLYDKDYSDDIQEDDLATKTEEQKRKYFIDEETRRKILKDANIAKLKGLATVKKGLKEKVLEILDNIKYKISPKNRLNAGKERTIADVMDETEITRKRDVSEVLQQKYEIDHEAAKDKVEKSEEKSGEKVEVFKGDILTPEEVEKIYRDER